MSEKNAEMKVREYDLETIRRNAGHPGTNVNGTGTKQLPPAIKEPEIDDDTTHKDEGQKSKEVATRLRPKRRILFTLIGVVLLIGVVTGLRYWLHARQYESTY